MTSVWKRNLRTACRSGKRLHSAYKEQTEKYTPEGFNTAQQTKQTSKPKPTARHSLIVWPERRNCNSCMQSWFTAGAHGCSLLCIAAQGAGGLLCCLELRGSMPCPVTKRHLPLSSEWRRNKAFSQPGFLNAFSL